jgi:hypothetical protein
MSDLNDALFRIDPTEGLLLYVQDIKPYHSKVLDILVEYVYTEPMTIAMLDRTKLAIGLPVIVEDDPLRSPQVPFVYSRGYGYVWSPYSSTMVGGLPQGTVLEAQGPLSIEAAVSGTTVTLTPDPSGYTFTVGQQVTLTTTGTFPPVASGDPISQGGTYYVASSAGVTITLARTSGGVAINFSGPGTGTLSVVPINLPVNSFLVTIPTPVQYDIVVASTTRNQFVFGTPFTTYSVNTSLYRWVVTGDVTIAPYSLTTGQKIYVNSNTDINANGEYTVSTVTYNGGTGRSTITVNEPISLSATATGQVYIPVSPDDTPYWPAGSAVEMTTSGTMPFPVQQSTLYYFVPTTTVGVFNLSTRRYPAAYSDIVNVLSMGSGTLRVEKVEPFVPGELVRVSGTYQGVNDGIYLTSSVVPEGDDFRIYVREHVPLTTPVGQTTDGIMSFVGDFGDPVGQLIEGPRLLTSTNFHERIRFDFGPPPLAAYILDTFAGTGNLSTHVADSGHTWSVFQLVDSLDELILTGAGQLVTADTDIWARANWAPPAAPATFYVEAEVFVKSHPGSGSPYFRMFAKESNLTNFYGPFVDIAPNLATGKIQVSLRTGDSVANTLYQVDTVNVNSTVVVRMEIVNQNQVRLYVDNTLLHTTATVSWPTFAFVGFNFRTPAGDPTQFMLERFLAD